MIMSCSPCFCQRNSSYLLQEAAAAEEEASTRQSTNRASRNISMEPSYSSEGRSRMVTTTTRTWNPTTTDDSGDRRQHDDAHHHRDIAPHHGRAILLQEGEAITSTELVLSSSPPLMGVLPPQPWLIGVEGSPLGACPRDDGDDNDSTEEHLDDEQDEYGSSSLARERTRKRRSEVVDILNKVLDILGEEAEEDEFDDGLGLLAAPDYHHDSLHFSAPPRDQPSPQ